MVLLHLRLQPGTTQIAIPENIKRGHLRLKSYRILFNRQNHGYYHASLSSALINTGNVIAYTIPNDAVHYMPTLPLFIDPENKLTYETVDWDLGDVRNTLSTLQFNLQFFNCIQRSRYDLAYFDNATWGNSYINFPTNIPSIQSLATFSCTFNATSTNTPSATMTVTGTNLNTKGLVVGGFMNIYATSVSVTTPSLTFAPMTATVSITAVSSTNVTFNLPANWTSYTFPTVTWSATAEASTYSYLPNNYFNGHSPLVLAPQLPFQEQNDSAIVDIASTTFPWTSPDSCDVNGNLTRTVNTTSYPGLGNSIYPSYQKYVHTGVVVGEGDHAVPGVDPQPGGLDYTTDPISAAETAASQNAASQGTYYPLTGSGIRRGPRVYPFSIDVIFEMS